MTIRRVDMDRVFHRRARFRQKTLWWIAAAL
jgi:hypothetical protein